MRPDSSQHIYVEKACDNHIYDVQIYKTECINVDIMREKRGEVVDNVAVALHDRSQKRSHTSHNKSARGSTHIFIFGFRAM